MNDEFAAWIATHESGSVLHFSTADGWKVEQVGGDAPPPAEPNEAAAAPGGPA